MILTSTINKLDVKAFKKIITLIKKSLIKLKDFLIVFLNIKVILLINEMESNIYHMIK
ncbi:hypothetical protein J3E07_000242 [Methanococcus voltae]|jgi:hypothetical protein|uniref:Uncharacterized protein n=2 Tax=Methanococcus voltae TaxID=2188 RepID=A0A8J7USN7_METVO|nr:hypothetical protein [Methanococcus voltae]MBP2200844.1 hypothetical protein [Methanococcus voltae]MCS3921568.1 hypothetical protein [Methanococcus voltae PS]